MGIGIKIKEYRNKAGLTQKDLADKLYVTYQAVSRWENDDAEPSFDMLKDMCRILNCSTDDLFEIEKPVEPEQVNQTQTVEKVIVKQAEQKPVLAVCEQCNKPIFESSDLIRVNIPYRVGSGRGSYIDNQNRILCKNCNEKRQERIRIEAEINKQQQINALKKKRIHSFVWSSLVAIIFIVFAITSFAKGDKESGIGGIIMAVLGYTFTATMLLNNTFLTGMWMEVTSWGFVKMPGIIFSFSFDGIVFLIAMKIFLFLLGIVLALLAASFATLLALVLSVFVYPFALAKNLKGKE